MADKALKTFILNDENVVNSYRFRVRNKGMDFTRFDENPVMLDSHVNRTEKVLGNWKNRRFEGAQLKMDANFDSERDAVKEVEGQVERGFVKGASLGLAISFDEECFERQPDGIWDLIKCEVMEGSVCGVPSNAGALALYNKSTGELITEDDVKLSLQNLSADKLKLNNPKMEQIKLTGPAMLVLAAIGLSATETITGPDASAAIVALGAALEKEKTAHKELKDKQEAQLKLQAKDFADQQVLEGKALQAEHEQLQKDYIDNPTLTAKLYAKMPGKISLNGRINNSEGGAGEVKTIDDFEKLSDEKKLAFKKDSPEAYAALFA